MTYVSLHDALCISYVERIYSTLLLSIYTPTPISHTWYPIYALRSVRHAVIQRDTRIHVIEYN